MNSIVQEIRTIVEINLHPELDPVAQGALAWELLAIRLRVDPVFRDSLTLSKENP